MNYFAFTELEGKIDRKADAWKVSELDTDISNLKSNISRLAERINSLEWQHQIDTERMARIESELEELKIRIPQ